VGDGGLWLHSRDGLRWTIKPAPTDEELLAIAFGARGFAAVAGVETIAVSVDGRSWAAVRVAN
jgi:hypothetical protein